MATMIEMVNSVSCIRDLIFYVHDLFTQQGNMYSLTNDAEDTWGRYNANFFLFTDSFDLSFCAKNDLNTEVTLMNDTGKYVSMAYKTKFIYYITSTT